MNPISVFFDALFTNIPFIAVIISLLLSQTIKVVYYYFVEKRLDLRHF